MDPQSSERSGTKKQSPGNNQLLAPELSSATNQNIPESLVIAGQNDPTKTQPIGQSIPAVPTQPTVPTPQKGNAPTTLQTVAPSLADDSDLIEKEWVDKAKQIVERNKEDPYVQSKELTIFKADYMKKRYNRTIKLGE